MGLSMNRAISLLILVFLGASASASNEDEVQKTINQYLDARASGNPNLAGNLIARESLEPIERMRQHALHADRKSLCRMSLSEVGRILVIRAKYRQFLAEIDAPTLAGLGIVDQPYMKDVPRDFQITGLTNNTATARVADPIYDGEHQEIDLVRERDKWRIRLSTGASGAGTYEPMWQQAKKEKGCDAALDMALDLIDRRQKTHLLDPIK
jgi:hypothetical protein